MGGLFSGSEYYMDLSEPSAGTFNTATWREVGAEEVVRARFAGVGSPQELADAERLLRTRLSGCFERALAMDLELVARAEDPADAADSGSLPWIWSVLLVAQPETSASEELVSAKFTRFLLELEGVSGKPWVSTPSFSAIARIGGVLVEDSPT